MNADNITRAIKRGTGELEGQNYEEATYEGTGPGGTLFIVEALTDNKNRTVAELRKIFEKNNGVLGSSGTAGWAFDKKGLIQIAREAADEDKLMDLAVGAGADDYVDTGDQWSIATPPDQLDSIRYWGRRQALRHRTHRLAPPAAATRSPSANSFGRNAVWTS